jgi:Tol biopolymer transport system component
MRALLPRRTASALFSALLLAGVCLGQTTERVSVDSSGGEGNGGSERASISANGRYVAYSSEASNLVLGDTNGYGDIFVLNRQTGMTNRVSVDSSGAEAHAWSFDPSISSDGRFVAFTSGAYNLVPGDTNNSSDIFVHDRQTGVTERVSVDSSGMEGSSSSSDASISADGRFVAFSSYSSNLVPGDTNKKQDVFVHDRQTLVTRRVSVRFTIQSNDSSFSSSISADGRFVAFASRASNLANLDTNSEIDVFVRDLQTGVIERVSVNSSSGQGNGWSGVPSISADGRIVAFGSRAGNLVPGDTNRKHDIIVHDRQTGAKRRASVDSSGAEGNHDSRYPSVSADGRYIAFHSRADNLVPGDTHGRMDAFVHDLWTGITERVSVNSRGAEGIRASEFPAISADGRYVAFHSRAKNLVYGDTNVAEDVFAHDRWDGLGANSIYLTGPATAPVGAPIDFTWQTTRGSSEFWLAYSKNASGSVINGHNFDLATPLTMIATGVNSRNGLGSFKSAPVPQRAAGHTLYFEVAARDANGVIYDSNVVGVTFH